LEGSAMRGKLAGLACVVALAMSLPAAAEPVIIEGVPAIGWAAGKHSYYISALQAVLSVLGSEVTYEELMVASGAAFRTAWAPGRANYQFRSVAPEDLVENAAAAAGATVRRRGFIEQDEAWDAVRESIDDGRPVIRSHGSGADVICGYDAEGRQMYLQPSSGQGGEYQVSQFETHAGPAGAPNEIIVVEYDAEAEPPELDWAAILARAVSFADWADEDLVDGYYRFGLGAYDSIAETLRGGWEEGGERAAELICGLSVVLGDARQVASEALAENATVHPGLAVAAEHYMNEAAEWEGMREVLTKGETLPYWEAMVAGNENLREPGVQEAAAKLVEQAKAEEVLAIEALRGVAEELGRAAAVTVEEPEQPQPEEVVDRDEADRLCQRGLELKRAGRYGEAAEALRAAIEADAEHVDAHWALAWVLIELNDPEGAAEAFRKVIELAPESERADEAQGALERLGN
jgi:tetratricopeptide (TPR) repeat protein